MTIYDTTNDGISYAGNDVATTFSFPFKVNTSAQIEVIIRDNNGVETIKIENIDYTVVDQDVEGSGIVTYPISGSPLATGYTITINPKMPYTQEADIKNQGRYSPEQIENAIDTTIMHVKELRGLVNRAIKFRKSSQLTEVEYTEDPVDNTLLAWDGATGKIKNVTGLTSEAVTTSFWRAVLLHTNLSDSLDSLGFSALGKTFATLVSALAGRVALGLGAADNVQFAQITGTQITGTQIIGTQITGSSYVGLPDPDLNTKGVVYLFARILLANNVTDPNNDIDFGIGNTISAGASQQIRLPSLTTKRLDASWVAGTNQGGLFSGSKAINTWYHCFIIENSTTGVVDVGFDTSPNGANAPAGFTAKKILGSILTDGSGNIRPFFQKGIDFIFKTPQIDLAYTSSTTATNRTISAPLGREVMARINVGMDTTGAQNATHVYSPKGNDGSVGLSAPITLVVGGGASALATTEAEVVTNTSSQIRTDEQVAAVSTIDIITKGWTDYDIV
jgi:hypothetical protein